MISTRLGIVHVLVPAAVLVACNPDMEVDVPGEDSGSSTSGTTLPLTMEGSGTTGLDESSGATSESTDDGLTEGLDSSGTTDGTTDTTDGTSCGDRVLDEGEQCDGSELGGASCESEGFDGGVLSCDPFCNFDTVGCYACGDGNLDPGETCDMFELGGQDCFSQGFDAGILGCDASCEFDTSGCYLCGNGLLEPGEVCDTADLGGATCVGEGFDGGTLACDATCSLDASGCYECGDGMVNPGEQCDGMDLGGQDCAGLGFDAGMLGCDAACGFDTTGCYECGDGSIDPGELCDGMSLGGATCISEGFFGGTLGCTAGCTLDVSMCQTDSCGNGIVDGMDQCEGADLGGQSCGSLGFGAGTLACNPSCTFDTSACCGDGSLGGTEACDGMDLGGATCTGEGFAGGSLTCAADCSLDTSGCYACGDGVVNPGEDCDGADLAGSTCEDLMMGFTGGSLACDLACMYDVNSCTAFPRPLAGEVVITEIAKEPVTVPEPDGEWLELHNPTAATFQLGGCSIEVVSTGESFVIDTDLVVGPDAFVTLAASSGGGPGFVPEYSWPAGAVSLPNDTGELQLVCDMVTVDAVAYDDGATFPDPVGASMSLDPLHLSTGDNDVGASWCAGSSVYNGDLGTPGAANPPCDPSYSIDFCALQFPTAINSTQGTVVTVYGRLYIAGLTDVNTMGNDPASTVLSWVGYGPDGSDPAVDPSWVWIEATPNPGWVGPSNDDEYQADIVLPAPGTYDHAYRFSGDFGASFSYCDTGPGNTNGYSPADTGSLISNP